MFISMIMRQSPHERGRLRQSPRPRSGSRDLVQGPGGPGSLFSKGSDPEMFVWLGKNETLKHT